VAANIASKKISFPFGIVFHKRLDIKHIDMLK